MSKTNFEGDVLFKSTDDGGEIVIEDGLVCDNSGFATSVYLSLFGGNRNDSTGRGKETWWGNLVKGTKENEKYVSKFMSLAKSSPMTSGFLKKAVLAIEQDLAWIKEDGYADDVEVQIFAESVKKVKVIIECKKNQKLIFDEKYFLLWEGAGNGL